MPDPPENKPEIPSPLNPVTEIKQMIQVVGDHFRQLSELIKIEAAEAGQFAGRKAALGVAAAVFALFFYLLLLCGLIGWLPTLTGWPWYLVALALAGLHLVILLILIALLKQGPKETFFTATKAQLEKDKQCLSQIKADEKKN